MAAVAVNPRDPGLQAERTVLAWRRTALALLAGALLVARMGWQARRTALLSLAAVLLLVALGVAVTAAVRHRVLERRAAPVRMPQALPALTAGALLVAAGGVMASLAVDAWPAGVTAP